MKRAVFGFVLWLCVSPAFGAAASAAAPVSGEPYVLSFDPQGSGSGLAGRTISGYDATLPGYHVQAEIATLIVSPRAGWKSGNGKAANGKAARNAPDGFTLAIRTSSAGRPMLEGFSLIAPGVTVKTSLSPDVTTEEVDRTEAGTGRSVTVTVPQGTYFRLATVGGEVRVTFLPKARALLTQKCRVEWVDWYRG